MPLEKDDEWFMIPNIPKKGWKNNESRLFVFQDDGRDMQTEHGPSVVFTVTQDKDPKLYRLWVPETVSERRSSPTIQDRVAIFLNGQDALDSAGKRSSSHSIKTTRATQRKTHQNHEASRQNLRTNKIHSGATINRSKRID